MNRCRLRFSRWCAIFVVCTLPASSFAQDFHSLAYAPAPVDNPLKGFVPYDNAPSKASFPHSLEWFNIPLAALMPKERTFDWQPLEEHLAAIAARGHHAVLRVYLDYPRQPPGTPRFLLDAGITVHPYDDWNNASISVSPDYENPRLRAALAEFIAAFGARYDGDARIGFITVGLLGYWGEWHTSDHKEWFASKTVQREVMNAYLMAFSRTRLLLRIPAGLGDPEYADNHALAMGYHDDSFAWATMPTGGPSSWHFLDRMARAGALDKWRQQPIGGEVRPEVWNTLWDEPTGAPKGQEYGLCVESTHATWLMNSGVFRESLSGAARERALAGARRLGYELHVSEVALTVSPKGDLRIRIRIRNTGVAPFYYPWPFELTVLDETGKHAATWRTDWDITHIAPDTDAVEFESTQSLLPLTAGEYQVLLRVVSPLPQSHPLRFANKTQDGAQAGWLTLGSVRR